MCSTPLTELIVRCYPGNDGCNHSYTLYEDDGITTAYQQGESASTLMNYRKEGEQTFVTIHPAYRIELPGIPAGTKVKVNGKSVKATFDKTIGGIVVSVKPGDIRKKVEVQIG